MLNPQLVQFMVQLQNQEENCDTKLAEKIEKQHFSTRKYGMFLPLKFAHVSVKS